MNKLIKVDMNLVKKFSNPVKYIDDLLALNNPSFGEEIANNYNIYLSELVLKKTTKCYDNYAFVFKYYYFS